ncbi:hypothetical protein GCM10010347_52920 [Streptomyces cirratus]|uniref:DUF6545 domain-containing protein n=1 Tax=Streptomyces cirratus TaxID=68187 RepID=A0ABQ3F2X3_9ACTN|nr:MAB_1171c family putative transporter [Streptomyces cirratus]GHB75857.1 hypothetical protein GCM10010347_52920 [Streptomyces cirratus]
MSILKITIMVMLWAVALWRLPSAIRVPRQRSLWLAFTGLALATTLAMPPISSFLDTSTHINNISVPAKHAVGIVACGAILDFVFSMARPQLVQRTRLPHLVLALAVMLLMGVLFAHVDQPTRVENFYEAYAGTPAATAYLLTFTAYLGLAMGLSTWLFLSYARHAGARSLRNGLRLLGTGTAVGVVYAVIRIAALVARQLGDGPLADEETIQHTADLVEYLAIGLIIIGNSLPAAGVLARTAADWRAGRRLRPLWTSLTEAVPDITLPTPHRHGIRVHLHRTVIEIRDASLSLMPYVSATVRDRADRAAEEAGLHGEEREAMAEALWLRAAHAAKLRGTAPVADPARGHGSALEDVDFPAEVHRLLLISAAYHSPAATAFLTAPAPESR